MQGRSLWLLAVVFLFFCIFIYPQESMDNFINNFYWYQKYLPLDNISDYQALRNMLIHLKENDEESFHRIGRDLTDAIKYFNNIAVENVQKEKPAVSKKIEELNEYHGSNSEVKTLVNQFSSFERSINSGRFPQDDSCIEKINELYSRLITRAGYRYRDRTFFEYMVKRGDALWKIAFNHYNGKKELWPVIWRDEINYSNRNFLPNPNNPNLIYPGVIIRIPARQE